jgi:hypothetical protein
MIGKEFVVSVADGRAKYRVEEVQEVEIPGLGGHVTTLAKVEFVPWDGPYGDEYQDAVLGWGCWVEASAIERLVGFHDRLNSIFGRKG